MKREKDTSELDPILKDFFKRRGFSLRSLRFEKGSLIADLLPIKNKRNLTTVHAFLLWAERNLSPASYSQEMDRLIDFFSDRNTARITLQELLISKPDDLIKKCDGIGKKSVEHLQSLVRRQMNLWGIKINPNVDVFMSEIRKN